MSIKSSLSRLLALALVVVIGLMGCGATPGGLTGKYTEDTTVVLQNLLTAIDLPTDATNKAEIQKLARQQINDYAAMYRRNDKYAGLRSFTTMQTALNSLAGFYSSYGGRPLPDKLKQRLKQEFKQVEIAIQRGG
jgi:photosystem II Psb27 protein